MDGLMPDSYIHPESHGLHIPTLRWMVEKGAASDGVESVFPTVTYPSHTSMVTGVNPGKHGIMSNRSFDPLENDLDGWRWYASEIRVDPIWRIAQRSGYDTALVHWPVSLGAEVRWLLPEFWRAKNIQDQKLMRVVSTPGLLDAVAEEHADFWTRYVPPNLSDDALTDVALHILRTGRPRLLFLHLVEVDGAQHRHGIDSTEARLAIENNDRQLARILQEVERLELTAQTAVVVISDHGFRPTGKMVRPCVLLKDAGLVDVTPEGRISNWKATALTSGGHAYIYVKDPADHVTRELVRGILARRQAEPESGIGALYGSDEIRARGGDASAFMAIEPTDDYQFGSGCLGSYIAPPTYRCNHGFDPKRPEMRASLLIVGPTIAHGTIEHARLIDLTPTIAQWLALPLPAVDGAPLAVTPAIAGRSWR
jgi:predicted AlkP superfamily pyrophosphatase or phosphodiesterase